MLKSDTLGTIKRITKAKVSFGFNVKLFELFTNLEARFYF